MVDTTPSRPQVPAALAAVAERLKDAASTLNAQFLDKHEIVRLVLISAIAGEHMVLIGPPGTAKSALLRTFAKLVDARYFEYLLTRFTEPNELFGPVDMMAFREGRYTRRVEGMLPEAEIVFLDEIFKSNSAILNSLLTILNERRFASGPEQRAVPLISVFGASNEVPNDEHMAAIFDRFLIRVVSENLDSFHFHSLIERGLQQELRRMEQKPPTPVLRAEDFHSIHRDFGRLLTFSEEFLAKYKGLVFQIRSEGISLSDRRVVKLLKLFAASALLDGRGQAEDADFFVLKHVWNNLDQVELLGEIVNPVVDAYYRDRPAERRYFGATIDLEAVLSELRTIRELFLGGAALSDVQLFSQLKNLNEIKAALALQGTETALGMIAQVDQLLETVFSSSKFGG